MNQVAGIQPSPRVLDRLYRLGFEALFPELLGKDSLPQLLHSFIQEQAIPGHLLLDVHDYRHVPEGPGLLLVAYEGIFGVAERPDNGVTVSYTRRRPQPGYSLRDLLQLGFSQPLELARRISWRSPEQSPPEPAEIVFFSHDRLLAPNDDATRAALRACLKEFLTPVLGRRPDFQASEKPDPRDRLQLKWTIG